MDKVIVKVRNTILAEVPLPEGEFEYSVGREPANQIVLEDQKASRRHMLIERKDGKLWVQDLGSTNGSFLNGSVTPLPPRQAEVLYDGDVIRIGDHELFFELPSAEKRQNSQGQVDMFGSTIPSFGSDQTLRIGSNAGGENPLSAQQNLEEQLKQLQPHLLVCEPSGRRYVLEITKPTVTIGRDGSNDIAIAHPSISSRHARLTFSGLQFCLEDLQSTNGTMVDHTLIREKNLVSPSHILFGDVECLFTIADLDSPEEAQRRIRMLGKNLLSQKLITKSQWENLQEKDIQSVRQLGEQLILDELLTVGQWIDLLQGKSQLQGRKKSAVSLWIGLGVAFVLVVALGLVYLIVSFRKQVNEQYEKGLTLWSQAKEKKDLKAFEEAEKALLFVLRRAPSSSFRTQVRQSYAKMLFEWGKLALSQGQEKLGLAKLQELFTQLADSDPLYRKGALEICQYYYKKAQQADKEEDRIAYLAKVVERGEELFGFSLESLKGEKLFQELCASLARLYFFQGLRYFDEDKVPAADEIWSKKVPSALKLYPEHLYQYLARAGSLACEYVRLAQAEDPSREKVRERFLELWQKLVKKYPQYLEELRKVRPSLQELSFYRRVLKGK